MNESLTETSLATRILPVADDALILGHRLSEWTGHAPELEIDMALQNMALDLLGLCRNLYQYIGEGEGKPEDYYPYLRTERAFQNCLLVELPNGNFADTIARQYFFDAHHVLLLEQWQQSGDERLAAIAAKSYKESLYHRKWSGEWVIRLGGGTEESHKKMQTAIDHRYPYTSELLDTANGEAYAHSMRDAWTSAVDETLYHAGLSLTDDLRKRQGVYRGGRKGIHTEGMGLLLAEMQYMQRAYPGMEW